MNLSTVDKNGCTILHLAARHGKKAIVNYLVDELHFDVNVFDSAHATPLHYASEWRYLFPFFTIFHLWNTAIVNEKDK